MALEDVSIGSLDDLDDGDGWVDGVAFQSIATALGGDIVALHSTGVAGGSMFDCGRNKLFLDSCATQHTMFAPEYLTGRHTTNVYLRQNCNAGSKVTNQCGYYAGLKFYVSEGGIANLLSVPALEKAGWKVYMETGKPFQVLSPDGVLFKFKRDTEVTGGMPYLDMSRPKEHITRVISKDLIACVETVRANMQGFTLEQCTKAKGARDAMAMMAHPPEAKMKHMVSSNNVLNIPFTSTEFANERALYGPDRWAIRGEDCEAASTQSQA